jgi:hypothetical protein
MEPTYNMNSMAAVECPAERNMEDFLDTRSAQSARLRIRPLAAPIGLPGDGSQSSAFLAIESVVKWSIK